MTPYHRIAWGSALCLLAAFHLPTVARAGTAALSPEQRCAALVERSFEHPEAVAKVTSATYEPERGALTEEEARHYAERGKLNAVPTTGIERIPAHCRVQGYVAPHVRFEVALPAQQWNGRMLLAACHGWCGQLNGRDCVAGLVRDYVTVTTDGGHTGLSSFDGVWAYDNPQAEIDFGYRANHVAAVATKAIIRAYYGEPVRYAYITGCSKGGQAGLMAAQRYPEDFDGVISIGPVLDYQAKNAIHFPWVATAVQDERGGPSKLPLEKLGLVENAVLAACDALDGRKDRVIDDPRACRFDPASLACPAGRDGADCLTPPQVQALAKIYAMPLDSRGEVIYPAGTPMGSEGAWPGWVLPTAEAPVPRSWRGADQYLKYLAFEKDPGPGYDFRDYDLDTALETLKPMSPVYDALSTDLKAFEARGGKLIILHGMADEAIPALMTIQYYEQMSAAMGGEAATRDFARLFLVPGVYHCGGGNGPDLIDALAALEAWRERGQAPDRLAATRDEAPIYQRTLLPYAKGRPFVE